MQPLQIPPDCHIAAESDNLVATLTDKFTHCRSVPVGTRDYLPAKCEILPFRQFGMTLGTQHAVDMIEQAPPQGYIQKDNNICSPGDNRLHFPIPTIGHPCILLHKFLHPLVDYTVHFLAAYSIAFWNSVTSRLKPKSIDLKARNMQLLADCASKRTLTACTMSDNGDAHKNYSVIYSHPGFQALRIRQSLSTVFPGQNRLWGQSWLEYSTGAFFGTLVSDYDKTIHNIIYAHVSRREDFYRRCRRP